MMIAVEVRGADPEKLKGLIAYLTQKTVVTKDDDARPMLIEIERGDSGDLKTLEAKGITARRHRRSMR